MEENLVKTAAKGFCEGIAAGICITLGCAVFLGLPEQKALGAVLFLLMGTLYFFLDRMGQPGELLPEIRPYYLIVLVSLPVQSLFNAFKQFFDGIGNTRTPMWIMVGANVFNIVGNWLLIYGVGPFPVLGLFGAGISTTLSRVLMLAVIYGIFISNPAYRKYREGFRRRVRAADRDMLYRLGWPLGLQMGMETASFSWHWRRRGGPGEPFLRRGRLPERAALCRFRLSADTGCGCHDGFSYQHVHS